MASNPSSSSSTPMKKILYECEESYKCRNGQSFTVKPKDPSIDQNKYSADVSIWKQNDDHLIVFRLKNPLGGETYRMEVEARYLNNLFSNDILNPTLHSSDGCTCLIPKCYEFYFIKFSLTCKVTYPTEKPAVIADFVSYLRKEPEALMTFECKDGSVTGVTKLMMSRSDVIEAMMNSDCIEARTRNVKIVDFPASIVRKMIEFCESNYVKETEGDEMELLQIANKYNIEMMKKYASELVTDRMSEKNVIELYDFAKMYNNAALEQECVQFTANDKLKILETAQTEKVDATVVKEFWIAVNKTKGIERCDKQSTTEYTGSVIIETGKAVIHRDTRTRSWFLCCFRQD